MPAYFCVIILLSSVCVCILLLLCIFCLFFVLNFILLVSIKYLVVKTVSTIVSD